MDLSKQEGRTVTDTEPIPIVFSANDAYVYYCYLAIYSLIQYAQSKRNYRIYVFVTDMNVKNQALLESLSQDTITVSCVDISSYTENATLKESVHLSIETYYRLYIPLALPQYERVVYLDSDLCVCADVAALYDLDLFGKPIGAVHDAHCEHLERHSMEIGDLDYRKTFNAGVLVMDTRLFEAQGIRQKCLEVLMEDYQRETRKLIYADQDALNIVLYENVTFLDPKWNCQAMYAWNPEIMYAEYRESYFDNLDNAYILHFAGERKPWMYPTFPKSDVFWENAKKTIVFEEMLAQIMDGMREKYNRMNCFNTFAFPYEQVPYGSKIAIYAAGVVGFAFYMQLKLTRYAEIVLWVDKNWDQMPPELMIREIKDVTETEYEKIIIAIDKQVIAEEVREILLDLGVPEEKIVWDEYRKKANGERAFGYRL